MRRRFSDFDAIAKFSRRGRRDGAAAAAEANPLQQRAEGFRQARMRGLALWAERVARVPTLLDVLTAAFFELPGAAPWDAALRAAASQSVQAGQLRWRRWRQAIELPHEEVLEAERRAAHELRVAADAMLAVERAAEALKASAARRGGRGLASAVGSWASVELRDADAQRAAGRRRRRRRRRTHATAAGRGRRHVGARRAARGVSSFFALESRVYSAQPVTVQLLVVEALRCGSSVGALRLWDARRRAPRRRRHQGRARRRRRPHRAKQAARRAARRR